MHTQFWQVKQNLHFNVLFDFFLLIWTKEDQSAIPHYSSNKIKGQPMKQNLMWPVNYYKTDLGQSSLHHVLPEAKTTFATEYGKLNVRQAPRPHKHYDHRRGSVGSEGQGRSPWSRSTAHVYKVTAKDQTKPSSQEDSLSAHALRLLER